MTNPRATMSILLFAVLIAFPGWAQKPPDSPSTPRSVPDPGESGQTRDIAYWRAHIDNVDRRIIELLNERAGYVTQLIPLKAQANRAVRDHKREAQVFAKLKALNNGPLPDQSVVRICQAIMAEMRRLQETAAPPTGR